MEAFKIEHFEREHPNVPFPQYTTLGPEECGTIRSQLARKLGLSHDDGLAILTHLHASRHPLPGIDAEAEDFDLLNALRRSGINPAQIVCVNWYRFDRIDRMALQDLASYFNDIWYPASDDIELFDDTLTWVLFISHYGEVAHTAL